MSIFSSSFFSLSGQKERLQNAISTVGTVVQNIASTVTFGAVPSAGKIVASSDNVAAKAAEYVANNPLKSAAAGAIAVNPTAAVSLAKTGITTAGSAVSSGYSQLSTGAKAATILAAPVVVSAVATNPRIVTSYPAAASKLGVDVGQFSKDPSLSSAAQLVKAHPVATAATTIATGAIAVKSLTPLVSTYATYATAAGIKDAAQSIKDQPAPVVNNIVQPIPATSPLIASPSVPSNAVAPIVGTTEANVAAAAVTKPKAKPKKKNKKAVKKKKKSVKKRKVYKTKKKRKARGKAKRKNPSKRRSQRKRRR